MPQMHIPSIGEKIRLTEDWEFPLRFERRNESFVTRLQPNVRITYMVEGSIIAILEKGTVLRVDRIYVRKGKGEWDSITFWICEAPGDANRAKVQRVRTSYFAEPKEGVVVPDDVQKFKGARFWAKLEDVNEIQYEVVNEHVAKRSPRGV